MFDRIRKRVGMGVGMTGLALLLGAPPASAGDEFEDGFKDELGRIAAHEAVRGGRQILASILLGGPPAVVAAPAPEPYYPVAPPPVAYYPPEPYGRTVYHRHDHYHHYYPAYPVAYGYYGGGYAYGRGHKHGHHHHRHHHGCRD